jgi:hypothetical protein
MVLELGVTCGVESLHDMGPHTPCGGDFDAPEVSLMLGR